MSFLQSLQPVFLSVLRIMSGLLLLQHGTTKYLSIPISGMNNANPMTMVGAAGIVELVCGALLVVGLLTRPAAFIASGMTAVAYFLVHGGWSLGPVTGSPVGQSFYPLLNGGELAALYSVVFLYLSAAGAGPISLDRLISKEA